MTAGVLFTRTLRGLEPDTDAAREALAKVRIGDTVEVDFRKPRSLAHHRWFWKMIDLVFQNQSYFATREALLLALKVRLGYAEAYRLKDGTVIHDPKSISFAKMNQIEFAQFADAAVAFICSEVIPGLEETALKRELAEMVGLGAMEAA